MGAAASQVVQGATQAIQGIVPVSIMPGVYLGIVIFFVGLAIIYQNYPQSGYWVNWQCEGEPCDEMNAPSKLTIVSFEILGAAVAALIFGSLLYKLMFYAKNQKILAVATAEQIIFKPL